MKGGINSSWSRTSTVAATDGYSLTDSPGTNYLAATDSWVRLTHPVDLSGQESCRLDVWVKSDLTGTDYMVLETSTNGTSWVGKFGAGGLFVNGSTNGVFKEYTVQLPEAKNASRFFIRFRLATQATSMTNDGVYIDDVTLSCLSHQFSDQSYGYAEGTSFATPLVSATAALIWSEYPSFTVRQVRSAILGSVDKKASLMEKTVTGGRLNVHQALVRAGTIATRTALIDPLQEGGENPWDGSRPAGGFIEWLKLPFGFLSVPDSRSGEGCSTGMTSACATAVQSACFNYDADSMFGESCAATAKDILATWETSCGGAWSESCVATVQAAVEKSGLFTYEGMRHDPSSGLTISSVLAESPAMGIEVWHSEWHEDPAKPTEQARVIREYNDLTWQEKTQFAIRTVQQQWGEPIGWVGKTCTVVGALLKAPLVTGICTAVSVGDLVTAPVPDPRYERRKTPPSQ